MDSIGIGLIGYGMVGRVHSLAYHELPLLYPGQLPTLRFACVCTSTPETAQAAASGAGYSAWCTSYVELVQRSDVDVVDCSAPNYLHRPVLLAAIRAGKHIYCEKPLALNGAEARELAMAAHKAGVHVGMTFNYRFVPALMRAHHLIQEGALGEIYSFRADYLHTGYQDPQRPMNWKMRRETGGGGALVDLGTHVIDLVRYLLGEFADVQATIHTFVRERPVTLGAQEQEAVTVEDAAWVQCRLCNGVVGSMEVSRVAHGALDELRIEIYGRRGALRFNLMDPNWLYWYDGMKPRTPIGGEQGWTRLETLQNYDGAATPPARCSMGWTRSHAENQYAFLRAVADGTSPKPDVVDGLRTQLVVDAVYASASMGTWMPVRQE